MTQTENDAVKKELLEAETDDNVAKKLTVKDMPKEELKAYLYDVIRSRIRIVIPEKKN